MGHILHEILGMRKLSARWVPRLLTPDKCNCETTSEQCLTLFKGNLKKALHRFVTSTHQRPRNSWNSGLHPANVLRRRWRLSYRPESWWPQFSGIHNVWSTLTTWGRTKWSQGSTMPNYCA